MTIGLEDGGKETTYGEKVWLKEETEYKSHQEAKVKDETEPYLHETRDQNQGLLHENHQFKISR